MPKSLHLLLYFATLSLFASAQSNFRVCEFQTESTPLQFYTCLNTVIFTVKAIELNNGDFDAACANLDWNTLVAQDLDGPFAEIEVCSRFNGRGEIWLPNTALDTIAQLALARDAVQLAQIDVLDPALLLICANLDVQVLNLAYLPGSRIWSAACDGVYPSTTYNGTGTPSATYTASSTASIPAVYNISTPIIGTDVRPVGPTTYSGTSASVTAPCTSTLAKRSKPRSPVGVRASPSSPNTTAEYDLYVRQVRTAIFVIDQLLRGDAAGLCSEGTVAVLNAEGYDGEYAVALLCSADAGITLFPSQTLLQAMENLMVAYIGLMTAEDDPTDPARTVSCTDLSFTTLEEASLNGQVILNLICYPAALATNSTSSTATSTLVNTTSLTSVSASITPPANITASCFATGVGPRCSFSTSLILTNATNATIITNPPTRSLPTTGPCTLTLCADYINACGSTYGGCYPACSGFATPTFTDPGCASPTSRGGGRGPFSYSGPWGGPPSEPTPHPSTGSAVSGGPSGYGGRGSTGC